MLNQVPETREALEAYLRENPEDFSFAMNAMRLAFHDIPVVPLVPRMKIPIKGSRPLMEATTDLAKIVEWNNIDSTYNVAMVAGEFCFLEFDVARGVHEMCEEMGQAELPNTRIQRSGKGFAHLIFKHTDRSKAIGNPPSQVPDYAALESAGFTLPKTGVIGRRWAPKLG
jgi:hypothetical protein